MITRAILLIALTASLCIAVPGTAWAQTNALKAGGVDDEGVAQAYYATIDSDNLRMTQDAWKEVNGFNDPLNKVVNARGYFNNGDLGFWRSINMVRDKRPGNRGNIAFTTFNYNNEIDSIYDMNRVSIVNMEYSPGPEGDDRLVKFYVFDEITGERKTHTVFAEGGEELYLPAACYSCHGGDDDAKSPVGPEGYNEGSGETNARFLSFDVKTVQFGVTPNAPSPDALEAIFKKFNKAVLRTDPTKATKALIKGLYGGKGLPRDTQDPDYVPPTWAARVDDEELYTDVIVPSCRSCHTLSDTKVLSLEWWEGNAEKIREEVFHELTMPNAPNSFNNFWTSINPNQSQILRDWLDAH
jgi:hypothetical protein